MLNSKIKWLFHYLGFIVERIPDEVTLFSELNTVDKVVQKYVLKKLVRNIRIANNHKRYNNLLKKYVPTWHHNFKHAKFIGNGFGENSFNTFRKVNYENKYFFEKIYFNDAHDLLKVEWFYSHVYPVLNNSIKTARLHKIIKGELISIVYFEFRDLKPLTEYASYSASFRVSQELFELSRTDYIQELCRDAPKIIKDYKLHPHYKKNIKTASIALEELSNNRLTAVLIEQAVDLQPLKLSHGDVQSNVFADHYLIDWDSFGFYPIGFESAFILYKYRRLDNLCFHDLQRVLIENYKAIIDKDQWSAFELTCFYFYFVFISMDGNHSNESLKKDVFARVQHLFYEKVN